MYTQFLLHRTKRGNREGGRETETGRLPHTRAPGGGLALVLGASDMSGTRPLQGGRLARKRKPHLDQSQPLASLRLTGLRSGRNKVRSSASPAWTSTVQD